MTASTGIISNAAGSGTTGGLGSFSGDGGVATSATFNYPLSIAIGSNGLLLYIGDYYNNRIRKVTVSTGIITTIAGSSTSGSYSGDGGDATSATLNRPYGVAVDSTGSYFRLI